MSRNRHTLLTLALVAAGALAALPAAAEIVSMEFHWEPSPVDDGGVQRPAAAFYEVFLLRGADGEAFAATVEDTLWTLDAEPDVVQRICVRGVDSEGHASEFSEWSDPVYFESQGGGQGPIPPAPELEPNYPNPFNPETSIVYGVPDDLGTGDLMSLEIYTVDGRRVRTFEVNRTAGWHEVTWDGRDDHGQPSAAGMYITRYAAGAMVKTGKMTMVK
ncbi:MAG: T9SS type A sorting domain-containing protein [bacterium]|nr:T9SS type A sorting domain-containing protein [bacterium]